MNDKSKKKQEQRQEPQTHYFLIWADMYMELDTFFNPLLQRNFQLTPTGVDGIWLAEPDSSGLCVNPRIKLKEIAGLFHRRLSARPTACNAYDSLKSGVDDDFSMTMEKFLAREGVRLEEG